MRARDNPFATSRIHRIRYRLPDGLAWGSLIGRLESMEWHGAIVGPEGAGKTTLLEDFAPRLIDRGFEIVWLRLTREQPRISQRTWCELSGLGPRQFLLFDGAEQLSWWAWWRFRVCARRAGGLLITSHRPGLLPTLLNCATTPELLTSLVAELLGEWPEMNEVNARRLHQKHRGNVRDALRELYDLWSSQAMDSRECPLPDAGRFPGRKGFSRLAV